MLKFEVLCKKVAEMFPILTQILRHHKIRIGKITIFSDSPQVEDRKTFSQEGLR